MPPRVLLLCYHFHPSPEVGAKRANALAEYLTASGAPPVVVSAFGGMSAAQLEGQTGRRFANCTHVHVRESRRELLDLIIRVKGLIRGRRRLQRSIDAPTKKATEAAGLKELFFAALHALDDNKDWSLRASRKAARAALARGTDIIFASGPPMSPLAAAILAGRRARIPVAIDFRDPCFFPLSGEDHSWAARIRNSIRRRFEAWVVRNADAVICTAPSLSELLTQRYPAAAERIHFIPNGFDGAPTPPSSTGGTLHIVFAGELYLNRNPFGFLNAVSALLSQDGIDRSRIRVTFVGQCDSYAGTNLRDWLADKPANEVTRILPRVGQDALRALYAEATVLLNLAQGQPMQIPAKTFEQLASGKELLLVCESESDTARIVRDVPGVQRVSDDDPGSMLDALRALYTRHVDEARTEAPDAEYVSRFSRLEQNRRLVAVLDQCRRQYPKSRQKIRSMAWLRNQLRLFRRLWCEVRPLAACLWLLDKLVGRFLPFEIVFIALFDRIDALADHATLPPEYRMERAGRETLEAIAAQHPDALSASFIDDALSKGDIPFAIFHGDEVAEFHWFATTRTWMFEGVWIHPPADRFYSYNGYVLPEHRGKALHSLGKRIRAQALSRSHLKGLVSFVAVDNASSLLSAGKIPGQRFGFALLRPRQGGPWAYLSSACREAGIRFSGDAERPENKPSMTSQSPVRL